MAAAGYFVLTLPLEPELWQIDILNKRFEVNRIIYNALVNNGWKRYRQMAQTRRYRQLIKTLSMVGSEQERISTYKELDQLIEEYRLRRYDFTKDSTQYRKYFEQNTDAPVVQNLAVHAWKAIRDAMKQHSHEPQVKKMGTLMSLEGKTNKTSIRFKNNMVLWKGMKIPVRYKGNAYEKEALAQEIRYCRIKWKWIRGKKRYYVDLILKGKCPVKKSSCECARYGYVGIDVGLKKIACVSDSEIFTADIPSKSNLLEKEKKHLIQKMERSRRAMNPWNYDASGRILAGSFFWNYSNNYRKYKYRFREIARKQVALREEEQNRLLGRIMRMGECFYAEKLDYAKMKSLHYGRKIEQTAIASFLQKAKWKMSLIDKKLLLIDPVKARAGSLNHITGSVEKGAQSGEFRCIEGHLIDRQIYSAFLLRHTDEVTEEIQLENCKNEFLSFLNLYRGFTMVEKAS